MPYAPNGRIESFVRKEVGEPPECLIYDVVELHVNSLTRDAFEFVPPPGAFHYDRASDAGYRQVVPGGFKHMHWRVEQVRYELAALSSSDRSWGWLVTLLMPAALAVLLIIIYWMAVRKWPRQRPAGAVAESA